jgi:hypothetical protein
MLESRTAVAAGVRMAALRSTLVARRYEMRRVEKVIEGKSRGRG